MRKRRLQTISVAPPAIQKAFEQFQKQNEAKNLSQGAIEFYSAKSKNFFLFLEDSRFPFLLHISVHYATKLRCVE